MSMFGFSEEAAGSKTRKPAPVGEYLVEITHLGYKKVEKKGSPRRGQWMFWVGYRILTGELAGETYDMLLFMDGYGYCEGDLRDLVSAMLAVEHNRSVPYPPGLFCINREQKRPGVVYCVEEIVQSRWHTRKPLTLKRTQKPAGTEPWPLHTWGVPTPQQLQRLPHGEFAPAHAPAVARPSQRGQDDRQGSYQDTRAREYGQSPPPRRGEYYNAPQTPPAQAGGYYVRNNR